MESKRDKKKADLKERLINAAEEEIVQHGLAGLKVRAVTARAGCALGALYNAIEDLDMLVFHVNSRTLARLGETLRNALPADAGAKDSLQALAAAYVDFAMAERNLWLALFDHRPAEGREVPDWHKQQHAILISQITPHLAQLRPGLPPEAIVLRARTTFAAVHGIVHLALEGRFVGVPLDMLKSEIAGIVETLSLGAQAQG